MKWISAGRDLIAGSPMNIFETIYRAADRRIERLHSQFLADALSHSLERDRSLFDSVWKLAAPPGWEVPDGARVVAEQPLPGRRRIDVCIRCELPKRRVMGIEVKTVSASAESGQLEQYLKDLTVIFPGYEVQVSYLTPFNRKRAGDVANSLKTVRAFDEFARVFPMARHISWLDVAEIPWDGNPLWSQHQEYVHARMSSDRRLRALRSGRDIAVFFGEEAADKFRDALQELGIEMGAGGTTIDLRDHPEDVSFAASLAGALEILVDGEQVSHSTRKRDEFPLELRSRFLDSPHREVHSALFDLSRVVPCVWVEGKRDYGIRTAHENHPSGVSLVTSAGPERLVVGKRR